MNKVFSNGVKFGILLQFAIGPLCLLTFNTAMQSGFWHGMAVVAAICFVDILYMLLAGVGIAKLMKSESIQKKIKFFGCIVLVLFGLNMILNAFGLFSFPNISLFSNEVGASLFIKYVLLSASNPLTIVFFSGIFSAQVAENQYTPKELFVFGVGIMVSTSIFLTGVSWMGSILSGFIPISVVKLLNVSVGLFLICFGLNLYIKK